MIEEQPEIVKGNNSRAIYIIKAGESVVACILTKVGKPSQGSEKRKGTSRDFRKKTRFKL